MCLRDRKDATPETEDTYCPRAAVTKCPRLGGLKQRCTVPLFWRPEVGNQGVSRTAHCL